MENAVMKREMTLDEYYDLKDSGPRNGAEATAAIREFALAQTEAFTKKDRPCRPAISRA